MSLGALEPKFWTAFCRATARDDLVDAQFDPETIVLVAELFRTRSQSEWVELAQQVDCCLEPLLEVRKALEHPQVLARELTYQRGRVPGLGEHTQEISDWLRIVGPPTS
jgi:crotonobetainyl-CoA:carnitine CoA-transferase CaiB-like acyl-CoA transferase